ncbi:hypothetical protein ACQJBY_013815 [Aegilops geniculata]
MSYYVSWRCLFLVLSILNSIFLSCSGCFIEERAALMDISSWFMSVQYMVPTSWGGDDDCCLWERVTCNSSTRRISHLDLSQDLTQYSPSMEDESSNLNLKIFSSFRELQLLDLSGQEANLQNFEGLQGLSKLKYLDLSDNQLFGGIPRSIGRLVSLEAINLNGNNMGGALQNIGFQNLRNLRELHLRSNGLSGSLPASLFALPFLEHLDLSENLFEGHIPINSSWNLRELYLTSNQLSGSIPASLFAPLYLEYLDLSGNFLQGPIPINSSWKCSSLLKTIRLSDNKLSGTFDFFWVRNCTKLKQIDLSRNTDLVVQVKMHGWVPKFRLRTLKLSWCNLDKSIITEPHFLRTQHRLKFLDLSNNNLPGSMPSWLWTNEVTLIYLNLANNLLVGSLDLIWQHQTNLKLVNISLNLVEGQLSANISLMFPNLVVLDVSHNIISGTIPPSLCHMSNLSVMDLSNNKFTGKVPSCLFTDCHSLDILKLSNNTLGGKIFDGASSFSADLWGIYLDNNKFEGTFPRNLSGDVAIMDLHGNKMSGELDTSFWDLPELRALSLASNGLTGGIHRGICKLTFLDMLDLSDNYFTGRMPNCSTSLYLEFLSVSGNSLSGLPSVFFNSTYITALDLSHNQFTGNLDWMLYLTQISVLLLSRNNFQGQISSNLCNLQHLSIIDISNNILSGSIPPCIGGIPFGSLDDAYEYDGWPSGGSSTYELGDYGVDSLYSSEYDLSGFTFTTKGNPYTYGRNFFMSMSGIDFSANMLSGEIPKEIGNLSHIKSLNLSNNLFTGPIPTTFANMSEIESLDLSKNMLNGSIPWQITRLSSLEVFSVADNNLSGCLPATGQLSTFDMDSYRGNNNLTSCISHSGPVGRNGTVGSAPDDSDPILSVVTAVSFVLAFWATITFVFCHSFGQRAIVKL